MRRFADGVEQFAFVIRVNCQGFLEPAGRDIELLAASGAERLGTFGDENAIHALALRAVRRETVAVRQVAVIFWKHPAICQFDVAVFGESFHLFQIAVVKPPFVFGKTILCDPKPVTGSESDFTGFINLEMSSHVQRERSRPAILPLDCNTAGIVCFYRDLFTTPEASRILMKLNDHAGLIIPGIGALRLRPLQVFQLNQLALIRAELLGSFQFRADFSRHSLAFRVRRRNDQGRLARLHRCRIINGQRLMPFIIIRQRRHLGLGTEFLGADCWYLPKVQGGQVRKPVQRVLDCWLRVAGLRTDYRVSKEIGTEAVRRKVNRWLEGKNQPTLQEFYQLVDEFSYKVKWLDEPGSWKARFTLACAAQRAWDNIDSFFKPVCPAPARQLARTFCDLAGKSVLDDKQGLLTLPDIFFASCLLQSRLEQEGKLEEIIAPARQNRNASFGMEVPDEEIEQWRRQTEWEGNPGNWFLEFIRKQAIETGHFKRGNHPDLKEYLFTLGIGELNRLVREQNKKAGK